jgi:hypothetical protein
MEATGLLWPRTQTVAHPVEALLDIPTRLTETATDCSDTWRFVELRVGFGRENQPTHKILVPCGLAAAYPYADGRCAPTWSASTAVSFLPSSWIQLRCRSTLMIEGLR